MCYFQSGFAMLSCKDSLTQVRDNPANSDRQRRINIESDLKVTISDLGKIGYDYFKIFLYEKIHL
jgi:hypothetical protein